MDGKGCIMLCKLKGWMDKGHYDVKIKGWIKRWHYDLQFKRADG